MHRRLPSRLLMRAFSWLFGHRPPEWISLPDRCLDGRRRDDAGRGSRIAPNTAQRIAPSAEHLLQLVAAGFIDCAPCHEPIQPDQERDLGHVDGDRLRYAAAEHRHSRDCSEGRNRATSRHRKLRETYLEAGGRRRSREW